MKIRNRLTLLFTLINATILLTFATLIYIAAKQTREKEFYNTLKKEAITKANLFLKAKVDTAILESIYKNNRSVLNEVQVAIYDTTYKLLYHDDIDVDMVKETRQMLNNVKTKKKIDFYIGKSQVVGLLFPYEGNNYVLTAVAYDEVGYAKLRSLLRNSIVVFIISIIVIYLAGRYFSHKAFQPVVEMTEKANSISATNLDLRLKPGGNKDELSELAKTFNEMLNRLENSFNSQKNFVSDISHELRTPLAALITELELSADKKRTVEEYRSAINNALDDAQRLARLSTSLLDLAKASYDPSEIAFREVRMDEILMEALQQIQKSNPHYNMAINFATDFDSDKQISITGNEYLLKVAFANLFENGCKFSADRTCRVDVAAKARQLILRFTDNGIGIHETDINHIFTPFYRGKNKGYAYGNGIGLSLTKKIVELHKGSIEVIPNKSGGTIFELSFSR